MCFSDPRTRMRTRGRRRVVALAAVALLLLCSLPQGSAACVRCGTNFHLFGCEGASAGFCCRVCPAGQKTSGCTSTPVNTGTCSTCPAGTWSNMGWHHCEPCPAGSYSTYANAVSATSCLSCAAGTHNPDTGQSTCKNCVAGQFANNQVITVILHPYEMCTYLIG
jgi:hypothetical protein